MELTGNGISKYVEEHTTDPSDILVKIERETYLRSLYPRMISGKVQGRFLSMISRMVRPKSILEIGTFTGYSTICLAEGLAKNGVLHTIEINEELKEQNEINLNIAGLSDNVRCHFGNALDIIPKLGISFDLAFIDADKINYPKYYSLVFDVMKSGGFILADNVLWSGKVLETSRQDMDKDTAAVAAFNDIIQDDNRVENVMIPLRDGMTLIRKI
jgi:predicted O-methyltransferase YrrM